MKPIAIASDHGGFRMKEIVKSMLEKSNISYKDYGTTSEESCDYPDYGAPAAMAVSEGESERAILFCGSGSGMAIVANKFLGVRAVNCYDEWSTLMSRRHNDANIMAIGERCSIEPDDILRLVNLWLKTSFDGGRHTYRISKITELERLRRSTIERLRETNSFTPSDSVQYYTPSSDRK
ncbi:MAG: ribose 5-phosphate isomerase B [Thaumarchaeota archaeon]|nr:ribose 5-phosphate isomerase B [Nitrososphaerota archaeon]